MAENNAYKKRVLIIGEYKAEKAIASSLIKRGCNVTVINENGNDAERLAEIKGLNVIFGNGSSKSILLDANVENADMVSVKLFYGVPRQTFFLFTPILSFIFK